MKLQAKGSHEVTVHGNESEATVQEKVQGPFQREPLSLPIHKTPQLNLEELAKQPKREQERSVQVCFPEKDPHHTGYVLVAETGLKGGGTGNSRQRSQGHGFGSRANRERWVRECFPEISNGAYNDGDSDGGGFGSDFDGSGSDVDFNDEGWPSSEYDSNEEVYSGSEYGRIFRIKTL